MSYSELEKIILSYPNKNWDFKWLSSNPNISLKFIDENPHLDWDYGYLSQHPKLTPEFIERHKYRNSENNKWDLYILASNLNLSIEYIFDNIDFKYHRTLNISCNHTVTVEFIKKNFYYPWDWNGLTISIKMSHIRQNPELPWGLDYHNNRTKVTLLGDIEKFKSAYKYKPKIINTLKNINSEFITNINNVMHIELNPSLTLEIIKSQPGYPWNFSTVSQNQFYYSEKKYYSNIIIKWYKRLKLCKKLWQVIEIMTIEQMKPGGKYMIEFLKKIDE